MSKTYQALKRAEREKAGRAERSRDGNDHDKLDLPRIRWELEPRELVEYQKLRVWLTSSAARGPKVQTVMVVSCRSGTGTTTTSALLASALADGRRLRVLIADVNFRTPALSHVFNVRNNGGVAEAVQDGLSLESGVQPTARDNLSVMTTGQVSAWPADVFEDTAIDQYIDGLKKKFDFVIFDGAPVLEFPDAYALAPKVDSIILVVGAEKTSIEDAQRAKRGLEQAGGRLLGVVVNRQKNYTPRLLRRLLGDLSQ